jgi:hypothetical protein
MGRNDRHPVEIQSAAGHIRRMLVAGIDNIVPPTPSQELAEA